MEEKLIIRSEFISFKPFKIITFVIGCLILLSLFFYIATEVNCGVAEGRYNDQKAVIREAEAEADSIRKEVAAKYNVYMGASVAERRDAREAYEETCQAAGDADDNIRDQEFKLLSLSDECDAAEDLKSLALEIFIVAICVSAPLFLIMLFIWLYLKFSWIIVSNKRIVGKSLFYRIDIPLDSVDSISKFPIKQIKIRSVKGTIRFSWIKNRDELYNAICDLLVSRQPELHTNFKGNIEI